jgi:hypothetical protein
MDGEGEYRSANGDIYRGIKYFLWLSYYEYKFILYIYILNYKFIFY